MFKTHRTYSLTPGIKGTTIAVVPGKRVGELYVMYHKTVVVETDTKGVTLRNGGWDTVSTRFVINRALYELGLPHRLVRLRKKNVSSTYLLTSEYDKAPVLFTGQTRINKNPRFLAQN